MMQQITDELIKELYIKYDGTRDEGGRDSWDVAADIINELLPSEQQKDNDASYYYHIHCIWEAVKRYVNFTYLENQPEFGVK